MALKVGSVDRLIRVCAADAAGRPPLPADSESLEWLANEAKRLRVLDSMPKPILQGRDLIARGMKPGTLFGTILKKCFEAQLDGAFSDHDGAAAYLEKNFAKLTTG
jgi:tRNA nucleotidyltransferase (CCA-adding enzyme)